MVSGSVQTLQARPDDFNQITQAKIDQVPDAAEESFRVRILPQEIVRAAHPNVQLSLMRQQIQNRDGESLDMSHQRGHTLAQHFLDVLLLLVEVRVVNARPGTQIPTDHS